MLFEIGERVKWYSTGTRGNLTRVGNIFALIPKNTNPKIVLTEKQLEGTTWKVEDEKPRLQDSYLTVVVDSRGIKRLYWPRVNLIERVDSRNRKVA